VVTVAPALVTETMTSMGFVPRGPRMMSLAPDSVRDRVAEW
jgi:hypothetical protein